jgi:putative FmdB family regulatory protein
MPIYEYQCKNCGMQKEFLRKVSDPPLITCPECGKETLHKMVTAAGFQLKGTGWYATDFKGGGKPAPAKSDDASAKPADAPAKADADVKAEAKAETKTETKTESAAPTT